MTRLILSLCLVMMLAGRSGVPSAGLSFPDWPTAVLAPGLMESPQANPPAGRTGGRQKKDRLPYRGDIRSRRGHGPARTTWVKTYWREGTSAPPDVGVIYGFRMAQANDGGLFLLGHTSTQIPASYDSCVLKVDPAGSIEWQKVFRQGSGYGYSQFLLSISPTADGGCVAGGMSASGLVAMKFDADGNVAWQRTFDRVGTLERFADLRQSEDGGYLLLASSGPETLPGVVDDPDVLLIKLDPFGDPVWQKTYGSAFKETGSRLVQLADGGFAVCGHGTSPSDSAEESLFLLRLTASGDILWLTVYPGWDASVFSFEGAPDGGFIVAGYAFEDDSQLKWDAWAMKLAAGGAVEWKKTYHGDYADGFKSILPTPDGGYVAAGSLDAFSGTSGRALLVKLFPNGYVEWQKAYGGEDMPDRYSGGTAVVSAPDGSFYLAGTTSLAGTGGVRFLLIRASGEGLVERLPGFVVDAGLDAHDSSVEALPSTFSPQDVPILPSILEPTLLEVAIRGGLLFSPPLDVSAMTSSSRSLALIDRTTVLNWEHNPADNDLGIAKYRIYSIGPLSPDHVIPEGSTRFDEVPGDVSRFIHAHVGAGGYYYWIWGVGADGGEGLAVFLMHPSAGRRP